MRSWPSFLAIALVVSLTPGPATAMILRTSARFGRRTALGVIAGHSLGVLMWAALSALGVSSLILASQLAYDGLKIGGALILVTLGIRSLIHARSAAAADVAADGPPGLAPGSSRPSGGVLAGWRTGLLTGVTNPKLAVFFIALFPQFLSPSAPVLPYALLMALGVVAVDLVWFSTLAIAVDRAGSLLRPRVHAWMERFAGVVMVGLGLRLAVESG